MKRENVRHEGHFFSGCVDLGARDVTSGARASRAARAGTKKRRDDAARSIGRGFRVPSALTRRVAPLAGATDAPRALVRIALPRSAADEPRRAAPATAKVDVTADMSCERVGRVWRCAFGGGTTKVVARCVVTRDVRVRRARVIRFRHIRAVTARHAIGFARSAAVLSHGFASFSEVPYGYPVTMIEDDAFHRSSLSSAGLRRKSSDRG
jgi:hypothetical protein